MFEQLNKKELYDIYQDYLSSKQNGRRCERFVPYAEEYKKQMEVEDFISTFEALIVVERLFFKEVAKRYFNEK